MNLFLNFEQFGWWMCLKIGEHLDIQISYKILQIELSQTLSFLGFLGFSACFQGRLFFFGSFHEKQGWSFRG